MKKLFIIIMAVCFTAACLTGCLGDSDTTSNYHYFTSTDKATIMKNMTGHYSGYIHFISSLCELDDSAYTDWVINNDTTITFTYPVSMLAACVDTTNNSNTELYNALLASDDVDLTMNFYIPSVVYSTYWDQYWGSGDYIPALYSSETSKSFTSYPFSFKLTYDNYYEEMATSGYYNFEYYNNQTQGWIQPLTLVATDDNGKTTTLEINAPSVFYGTK